MQIDNRTFFEQITALLREGRGVQIAIRGNSMRPLLRNGRDIAVLRPCRGDECRPGDVVLFRHEGRHVLHRIIRRHDAGFLLRGDGNYRLEEQCTTDDILALMTGVIRPSGRLVSCHSRRWRWTSRLWLTLPRLIRRLCLATVSRLSA